MLAVVLIINPLLQTMLLIHLEKKNQTTQMLLEQRGKCNSECTTFTLAKSPGSNAGMKGRHHIYIMLQL